ncbi:MAG: GspH/FimT family pseudopilin [Alphaproteobacteria bacterium]|nr:GspH/FimT family pseudopilin [Alphaproteobacteria bacterium]
MSDRTILGFTLLELLVVLSIIALMLGLAVPRFAGVLPGARLDSGARELASGLREARSRAVALNREVRFTLDRGADRYFIGAGRAGRALPQNLDIALLTGRREIVRPGTGSIRFFPDGSSTGGRIELSSGTDKRSIEVDWLTGRIRLAE